MQDLINNANAALDTYNDKIKEVERTFNFCTERVEAERKRRLAHLARTKDHLSEVLGDAKETDENTLKLTLKFFHHGLNISPADVFNDLMWDAETDC
jgi:hypothetical protein